MKYSNDRHRHVHIRYMNFAWHSGRPATVCDQILAGVGRYQFHSWQLLPNLSNMVYFNNHSSITWCCTRCASRKLTNTAFSELGNWNNEVVTVQGDVVWVPDNGELLSISSDDTSIVPSQVTVSNLLMNQVFYWYPEIVMQLKEIKWDRSMLPNGFQAPTKYQVFMITIGVTHTCRRQLSVACAIGSLQTYKQLVILISHKVIAILKVPFW